MGEEIEGSGDCRLGSRERLLLLESHLVRASAKAIRPPMMAKVVTIFSVKESSCVLLIGLSNIDQGVKWRGALEKKVRSIQLDFEEV